MKKAIAILLLVVCASMAYAQAPRDVPRDHWAYESVNNLMSKGYIAGFPDGNFGGNRNLTRYEFATIIKRILDEANAKIAAAEEAAKGKPGATEKPGAAPSVVTKEDLAQIAKLVDEFKAELIVIGTRLDKVETELAGLAGTVDTVNAIITDPEGAFETMKSDVSKMKKVTVGGYVQSRYQTIDPANEAKTEEDFTDTFIVRRARVKVTAKTTDKSQAVLQLELAKNSVGVKDAYFVHKFTTDPTSPAFTIGQFNWPFGYEAPTSSSVREAPERTLITRRLFPGERDQGAKMFGPAGKWFDWQLGLFNGTGTEKGSFEDKNDRKDIIVNLKKEFSDFNIGVSYYGGQGVWQTFGGTFLPYVNKSRYGADLQYYLNNITFKAEYYRGRGVDTANAAWDQSDFVDGYYGQLALNMTPANQFVARYSSISTDPVNPKFGRINTWDLGLVHWLDNNSRVKLFYKLNNEEMSSIDNNGFVAEWIVKY